MIEIPSKTSKPLRKNPRRLLLFGKQKVGKTSKIAELGNDCLIIDTEEGTEYLECRNIKISNLQELAETLIALRDNKQKYIALDTIDMVYDWIVNDIITTSNVKNLSDIGFGGGFDQARNRLINFCENLAKCCETLIVIGHLKRTIIGETSLEVDLKTLDLPGKAKNMLGSWADACGFIYRDDDSNLKVAFVPSKDVEAGTRNEHLKGKNIPFDWKSIFIN